MPIEKAIWHPFWYELDQPIKVGCVEDFDFYLNAPSNVASHGLPVFYNGNWNDKHLYFTARKRILSIWHPRLGRIQGIDTKGLDYTFTLCDGKVLKVEAEESPGLVYDLPEPIAD